MSQQIRVIPEGYKTAACLYDIPHFSDQRGDLTVIEWEKQVPFKVKRLFYTYNTPAEKIRGEHAHKECHQFLIAVAGRVNVIVDDGKATQEFVLDSPSLGLYLPAGVWGIQHGHQPGTVLLVLASHEYDHRDYIRNYDEFIKYIHSK
jgi:hypothetical protein